MFFPPILECLQDSEEPPFTRETIERLELELRLKFPSQYAEFLLAFNGGYFHRTVSFYLPVPTEWVNQINLRFFYGEPEDHVTPQGLSWYADVLSGRIPDGCLAIANCDSSDVVLLTVAGDRAAYGSVWFLDSVEMTSGTNVHYVADSFNEFLSMLFLELEESEECETIAIFQAIERGNLRA